MNFNLEYYRAFFMTANFLSFTQAAAQLCLTQSAVSQSVKRLEQELDVSLFVRSPRGLQLTKEGELLFTHVKKAFQELETGERTLSGLVRFQAGELRIGATETSLHLLLGPALGRFREQYPDVRITFSGSTTRDTCSRLRNGEIELAFLLSPLPEGTAFTLTELMEVQDVFTATSRFPIDFSRTYTPAELTRYPLIAVSPENSVRRWLDQWFLAHDVLFVPDYTVRGTGLALPLLTNHLGIAILPEHFLSQNSSGQELRRIRLTEELPPRRLYLATDPRSPLSGTAREFARLVTERI